MVRRLNPDVEKIDQITGQHRIKKNASTKSGFVRREDSNNHQRRFSNKERILEPARKGQYPERSGNSNPKSDFKIILFVGEGSVTFQFRCVF